MNPADPHPDGHRPLISVIIPAYNSARFVSEAIQSVLDQSFCDHEIIVVDDGSSDATRAVASQFPRVQVVTGEHLGNAAARNRGVARAHGEWLCFLDADDLWTPWKLERQLNHVLSNGNSRVCFPGAQWFYDDSPETETLPAGPPSRDALWNYLVSFQPFGASLSGVMVHRSCFKAVGGFDENLRLSVDWDMWIRLAARYELSWFDDQLVYVRLHQRNANRASDVRLRMYLACLRKHRQLFCHTRRMRRTWHASYGSRLVRLGRHLLKHGRYPEAWRVLIQATRYGGRSQLRDKAALLTECRLRAWRLAPLFSLLQHLRRRLAS